MELRDGGQEGDSNTQPKTMDSIILICLSVNLSLKVVNKKQYAVLIPLLLHERNIVANILAS